LTALERLAAWAAGLAPGDVPQDQLRLARLRLLDTTGLVLVAWSHPVGTVLDRLLESAPPGASTVLGRERKAAPGMAALINGTLAHARDFDDTFPDSVVHPGSVVVPAALAAGEAAGASLDEVASAVAVGYEIAARLGGAAGRGFHARGFHATGVVGPIAAAAAAGRLHGVGPEAMADAFGLATSASGGLLAFLADGAWSKWFHTGWAAQAGLTAVELGRAGFRGPRAALDHAYGLYGAFLGAPLAEPGALTAQLGEDWRGGGAASKRYPCAHVIQPFIDGALELRAAHGLRPERVSAVSCRLAPWAVPIVAEPRRPKLAPRSDLDAIASLPFLVAAALVDGRVDLATLDAPTLARADILTLAERVGHVADPAYDAGFSGRIEIAGPEGVASREVAWAERPGAIEAKFRANAARAGLPSAAAEEIAAGLRGGELTLARLAELSAPRA
jgi:2-methylcitrate dehydratase PrpD